VDIEEQVRTLREGEHFVEKACDMVLEPLNRKRAECADLQEQLSNKCAECDDLREELKTKCAKLDETNDALYKLKKELMRYKVVCASIAQQLVPLTSGVTVSSFTCEHDPFYI
jgi:chromosome segregation ATPase